MSPKKNVTKKRSTGMKAVRQRMKQIKNNMKPSNQNAIACSTPSKLFVQADIEDRNDQISNLVDKNHTTPSLFTKNEDEISYIMTTSIENSSFCYNDTVDTSVIE
ncbi:hypothetical protein QTP88_021205 [Uroleucon formosanum]